MWVWVCACVRAGVYTHTRSHRHRHRHQDIWSLGYDKMENNILWSSSMSIVLCYYTSWTLIYKKYRPQQLKYSAYFLELIFETSVMQPFSSHLANHQSRKCSAYRISWRCNDELISDVLLCTPTHWHLSVCWSAKKKTYILQLCTTTICRLEDPMSMTADKERWRKRVKWFHVVSTLSG